MSLIKPIRSAVIGCGTIGPVHAQSYQMAGHCTVAWACDLVAGKAQSLAEKFGVSRVTADYREVLADPTVDCVSVCTDHGSHAAIVCDALAAGKHVICEKALGHNRAALDRMMCAAAQHPALVFAGVFQHRFEAINRCLKKHIDNGALGRILLCSIRLKCLRTDAYYNADAWRGTWAQEGGSALINQAIHFIDIGAWLMGGVKTVQGAHANLTHRSSIETEDTAVASLQFVNGALGVIEVTASSKIRGWDPALEIHGEAGVVEIRQGKVAQVSFLDNEHEAAMRAELAACDDLDVCGVGKSYYGSQHPAQIADFVAAIREGGRPFVSGRDARHGVDIVLGVYESCQTGQRVEIARPDNDE
jgi:predicted dehydrogenase